MMHFLNITGAFLYLAFRIAMLPMLAFLYSLWMVIVLIRSFIKVTAHLRTLKLKPIAPLYRFVKFRLNLSK